PRGAPLCAGGPDGGAGRRGDPRAARRRARRRRAPPAASQGIQRAGGGLARDRRAGAREHAVKVRLALVLLVAAVPARAGTALDRPLAFASRDGFFHAEASGLLDAEAYWIDQRPPGLLFGDGESFGNPRLSLFLDARAGRHLYG